MRGEGRNYGEEGGGCEGHPMKKNIFYDISKNWMDKPKEHKNMDDHIM